MERFLSLYFTALLDVTGEDSVLVYWQRKLVKSIKYRGATNCGTCDFVKNNDFLMKDFIFSINLLQLKIGFSPHCFSVRSS